MNPNSAKAFLSNDGGETYNRCHCEFLYLRVSVHASETLQVWSNFEIADLDFWRSEAYMKFFTFLDKKGGFYYEVRNAYHKSGS